MFAFLILGPLFHFSALVLIKQDGEVHVNLVVLVEELQGVYKKVRVGVQDLKLHEVELKLLQRFLEGL